MAWIFRHLTAVCVVWWFWWGSCKSSDLVGNYPLSDFDIPPDSLVLVNFVNEPQGIHSKHHRCVGMEEGRKCMNVSSTVPIFEGKGCYGYECMMNINPGPSSCMLQVADPTGNHKNKSRQLTCGVDPDDELIMQPQRPVFGPPASAPRSQLGGLPTGVVQKVFYPCVGGKLRSVVRLTFPRVLSTNYTCLGNPKCLPTGLSSQIVCYTEEHSGAENAISRAYITYSLLLLAWLVFVSY